MKRLTSIFSSLLMSLVLWAQPFQYNVQHYSVANGLSQNTVMSILQDRDGFMWFGTWDGLNRFDGYQFRVYKSPLESRNLTSNRVDYIYEDSLGFIWYQTNDGAFYRLNKRTNHIMSVDLLNTSFGNGQQFRHLLFENKPGEIWLAGDKELQCIDEDSRVDKSEDVEVKKYPMERDAVDILSDTTGVVWVLTDHGLLQVKDGEAGYVYPAVMDEENSFSAALSLKQYVWFGTDNGVIWRYNTADSRFSRVNIGASSSITKILSLNQFTLLILTKGDGFFVYDMHAGATKRFAPSSVPAITSGNFYDAYVDRYGVAWLVNQQAGVFRFDMTDFSVRLLRPRIDMRYANLLGRNFMAMEDKLGRLWLNAHGGGFFCYNRETNEIEDNLLGLSNMIHTAYADNKGTLWICTYDLGLDHVDIRRKDFNVELHTASAGGSSEVRAVLPLRDGTVLVASKDGFVRQYDAHRNFIKVAFSGKVVYSLLEDADGNIWFGTKGEGIYVQKGGQMVHYHNVPGDPYSLSCDAVYDLLQVPGGDVFVATYGGGINIFRNGKFVHAANEWIQYPEDRVSNKIRDLEFWGDSLVFAASTNGLLRVHLSSLQVDVAPYFDVRALLADKSDNLWIGSFGGGLVRCPNPAAGDFMHEKDVKYFAKQDGLRSDIVLSLLEDASGNIWFSSENVLSCYSVAEGTFRHFDVLSGSDNVYFSEASPRYFPSGEVVFGCTQGVCTFSPDRLAGTADVPTIVFTGFQLFNKEAEVGGKSPLKQSINYLTRISLAHSQSIFTIEYAALSYAENDKIQYAYKLEGVDKDWNYVLTDRHAMYSHLSSGTYTFRVRSTNAEGVWMDNERQIVIRVRPSFWVTPWALLIYLVILSLILYWIYYFVSMYSQLRQEVAVEQKVTDIKLRFFTNISHELRTPLTLISGPVDNILKNEKLTPSVRSQLEIVSSNSARMLRLINQILDFRKIQNKKMRLKIQQTLLKKLVQDTCANFNKEAYDKQITFTIQNEVPDAIVWVDRDKLDTILFNLLSNAFKYTPAGKSITVRVAEQKGFTLLQVIDTGQGIPKDKRSVLFERFSSQNEIRNKSAQPGTGIGLNLVKELVDLHKGYIEVESEVGQGSTFTIMLREGKEHFGNDVDLIIDDSASAPMVETAPSVLDFPTSPQDSRHAILVVDDNEDMRSFLHNIFSQKYNVTTASDGVEALEKAKSLPFDIVVTDLMMPNMDGIELTDHLKNDQATSHLPVVLLTAKSAIESRLEALKYGADDYITKPFSPEYLLARVENILQQRERLRETYRSSLLNLQPQRVLEPSPNEAFLAKLLNFMEQNMDNNELAVEDLVNEMALGRTVFFNKLKSLTGLSPVEFIREVRIKRAAQLLESGQYNITEITYMVGMNDSRYFAKCFKAAFGVTPTEYRKKVESTKNE